MHILYTFLINILCYLKSLVQKPDYQIISRELEYWVDHGEEYVTASEFWEEQSDNWCDDFDTYLVTLKEDQEIPEPPGVVTKMLVRVKFWYNNHVYKYLTYDHTHTWPPDAPHGMHFSMPLSSAQLLDAEGTPMKDVLGKIKRYAGPKGDFYGKKESVRIADMFYYDEATLKETFPKISLKNVFGMKKIVSTTDGYISDLRIP